MESVILAILAVREQYYAYRSFLKNALSAPSAKIVEGLGEYYAAHPSTDRIRWSAFKSWGVLTRWGTLPDATRTLLMGLCDAAAEVDLLGEDATDVVHALVRRSYASRVAELGLTISEGGPGALEDASRMVEEYLTAVGKVDALDKHVSGIDALDLEDSTKAGYQWRLNCLNVATRGVGPGDLVVVAARPDSGKSTFLCSEVTHLAQQLPANKKVLWAVNEERGARVKKRIVQAALGIPTADLERDLRGAMTKYTALMGCPDKITVFDRGHMTSADIERLLRAGDYGLVVVDQLWKIHVPGVEGEVERISKAYTWAREIAKDYCPLIGVHQATGEAEGVRWLNMGMLHYSRVGVQGEADALITIGREPDGGRSRFITLPKNKIVNPAFPNEANGKWEVELDADRARFEENAP